MDREQGLREETDILSITPLWRAFETRSAPVLAEPPFALFSNLNSDSAALVNAQARRLRPDPSSLLVCISEKFDSQLIPKLSFNYFKHIWKVGT